MWYSLVRSLLFQLEPERAHSFTCKFLQTCYFQTLRDYYVASLPKKSVDICGLQFTNPLGIAAGLDKNGDYISALQGLGVGFIELGTVTPKPQEGNPRPRLFRIPQAQALINRMGFNNKGVDYLVDKLQHRPPGIIIGANIGKNKQTPLKDAALDYCLCLTKLYTHVDYVTINISSPNTPELRRLQTDEYLCELLTVLTATRQQLQNKHQHRLPLWLKIAPDLTDQELASIVELILTCGLDGIVATNTTTDHQSVSQFPYGDEQGGLSGAPLFDRATAVIHQLHTLLQGKVPIIAVGGIMTAEQALSKLAAGASLVQLYTGLIYQGPKLIKDILTAITDDEG